MTPTERRSWNEFPNGLAVYVIKAPATQWDPADLMVVIASDPDEARGLAHTAARRRGDEKPTARRWLNPDRSTCVRQSAGHPHVIARTR